MENTENSIFEGNPDFATLGSSSEYGWYFHLLSTVFSRLLDCYETEERGGRYEAEVVAHYLRRLLYTLQALRVKYTYKGADRRSLWVDLTESGYPNCAEFEQLATDLRLRQERLHELPVLSSLKRSLLDHLFDHHSDPELILQQLSERCYFEMLDAQLLFLPFTPGVLRFRGKEDGVLSCMYSWACYDFASNRAYVHVMTFDYSGNEEILECSGPDYDNLLTMLRREGSRAPDVGVLALAIDDGLESVHPKIIKRLCIGPCYSRMLLDGRPVNREDPREVALRRVFEQHARSVDDFVLFFSDEIVFSKRQEISRSLFAPGGKVREIFAVQESDPECYERRASVVHHNVLLPHYLLQHISQYDREAIPAFEKARKFSYDEKGEVHGI